MFVTIILNNISYGKCGNKITSHSPLIALCIYVGNVHTTPLVSETVCNGNFGSKTICTKL